MTYKFDDVDNEGMDDVALSEHIEPNYAESGNNKTDEFSMDALDIYDSYYE